jgi:hypothetical protein
LVVSKVDAAASAARMYVSASVVIGSGVHPRSAAVGSTTAPLGSGPVRTTPWAR